jgi:glycosyltransferase involved in cell wall biosynthesis
MSDNRPRVSIGLPVFNGENYLEEALDSILAQTYTDFELIISDNASTDRTPEICKAYAARDRRIRYYRNETNLGAAKNYNRVFELSSGEYFKWAAHDDLCAPELLARCVEVLDHEPEAIMCYAKTILIDEQGEVIEYHHDGFDLRSPKPHERFRQFFHSSAWCHPVFGVIRANILKKTALIGNFASSDKVLLGELAILGKCYEVPEYLAYRRIHPQISTKASAGDEERATWFDPTMRGRVLVPRWKRFLEHIKAIRCAPLTWYERVSCYIELGRFYLAPGRFKGVARDLSQVGRVVLRFLSKCKQETRNTAPGSSAE